MSSCRQNIATCQTTASEGSLYISDHFTFTVLPPALPCPPNSLIQCLLVAGCPIVARVNSLFSCQLKHMLNHYDPNFRKIEAQPFAISQDPPFFSNEQLSIPGGCLHGPATGGGECYGPGGGAGRGAAAWRGGCQVRGGTAEVAARSWEMPWRFLPSGNLTVCY